MIKTGQHLWSNLFESLVKIFKPCNMNVTTQTKFAKKSTTFKGATYFKTEDAYGFMKNCYFGRPWTVLLAFLLCSGQSLLVYDGYKWDM